MKVSINFPLNSIERYSTKVLHILNLAISLGLLTTGARGRSFNELTKVLGLPRNIKIIPTKFQEISKPLKSVKQFTMCQAMYIDDKIEIEPSYKELAKKYFEFEIRNADFGNERSKTVSIINSWISKKTNKLIENFLTESSIDSLTRLILVNAILFKGTWVTQFDETKTHKRLFTAANGQVKKIDMMNIEMEFRYIDDCKEFDAKILNMPFAGDHLSFIVILPNNKRTGFINISSKFDSKVFEEVIESMIWLKVNVVIPKFKMETTKSLKESLKKLGIGSCFNGKGSFKGISPDHNLFISDVLYKAVIDVNEEGTVVAEATSVIMMLKSTAFAAPSLQFVCDRPFQFFIYDEQLNLIVFAGHFSNPSSIL
ncbi:hypothetical protein SNEBB_009307 [Seison nebaliae]|nr:hypothetical protein SNEBB_009307 [Seison nebaliae]